MTFDVEALQRDLAHVELNDRAPVSIPGAGAAIPDWTGASLRSHDGRTVSVGCDVVRIHVPIVTHDQVSFVVDGQARSLRPGETWFVDVSRPHSVVNRGETPRVHLVVDCVVNDWVRALIGQEDLLGAD